MAIGIRNSAQYEMAVWWLKEFEQALMRMTEEQPHVLPLDPKMLPRIFAFQSERRKHLCEEISRLRKEIQSYESRSQNMSAETESLITRG